MNYMTATTSHVQHLSVEAWIPLPPDAKWELEPVNSVPLDVAEPGDSSTLLIDAPLPSATSLEALAQEARGEVTTFPDFEAFRAHVHAL